MKLIECNISKFGVICNQKITFSPKLNCIIQENGAGKTTLCAFIKAMLYGIGDTKRQSLDENDRKRYLPWSGGTAQGSLTFSVGDKVYRVERSFGSKASEDTFALYDAISGQISTDYTEQLGCELFGIDRDGYEETVYFSERALTPTGENKSVSAKLSDLVGADGDIGVMDNALKILEGQRKFLQKKGGAGAIYDTRRALDERLDEILKLDECRLRMENERKRLAEIASELESIRAERDALMKMQADSAKRELFVGFEERCRSLLSEIEREVAEKDEIIQRLGGEIPEREYIDALRLDYLEAQKLMSAQNEIPESNGELRELSLLFVSEEADEDMVLLGNLLSDYKELTQLRQTREYLDIKSSFSKRIPSAEECDEAIESLTKTHPMGSKIAVAALLLTVALASAVLGVFVTPILFSVTGVTALVAIAVLSLSAIKRKNDISASISRAQELLLSISDTEISGRSSLITELIKVRTLIDKASEMNDRKWQDTERNLHTLIYKYGKNTSTLTESAESLIAAYERYKLLRMREGIKLEGAEKSRSRADELLAGVKSAFARIGIEFKGGFSEIYAYIDRYKELSRSIIAKREEYTRYKTETTVDTSSPTPLPAADEIRSKISVLDARTRELNAEGGIVNSRISELIRRISERDALISEKAALEEKLSGYEENLAVISKTKELLTKANDNIQSKYLGKTEGAFCRYIEKISGAINAEYRLDTDFAVTKSEGGISRPAMAYSRGTRELYNLSARLALIDSLYEGESPFIVLDDPFAYFDDKRLSGARDAVRALSEDRQIIYLTCMKSRCI